MSRIVTVTNFGLLSGSPATHHISHSEKNIILVVDVKALII